jgi:hypothetical protein
MNEPTQHSWFESTRGLPIMSHNGSASRSELLGTVTAFHTAYDQGYRWMQVDALPIRTGLISRHATFGRRWGYRKKDRAAITDLLPDVPTLDEIMRDPKLHDVYWNIEMKSVKGLAGLLQLLALLKRDGRDLSTVMISSPMRPAVLKAVASEFPEVALAAPVIHGGVFGKRLLGAKRAQTVRGPYDCQQCLYRFVRKTRPPAKGPIRQAWTITNSKTFDRILGTGAHPIIDSLKVTVRRSFDESGAAIPDPTSTGDDDPRTVDALALGGGGWRGAFGGIGAVMYFADTGEWKHIRDIVGISGGSFAVAALSAEPEDERPGDDDPAVALKTLLERLSVAARRTARIVTIGIVLMAILVYLVRETVKWLWDINRPAAIVFLALVLMASSFLARLYTSARWSSIVKMVYRKDRMRTQGGVPERRYAIGSTGLNDGRLYSFTSDPIGDKARRATNQLNTATPLGDCRLSYAVVRATSLPGLGQLGVRKIYPDCAHDGTKHRKTCVWVPDKLVDGGLTGIFGRQLVQVKSANPNIKPLVVVVDAGRKLEVNNGGTLKDRATGVGERASALLLLVRWLKVALEDAYRGELRRVADGHKSRHYRYQLVRLAEEEDRPGHDQYGFSQQRHDDLNRLYALRDQVHSFSLMKSSHKSANRAITVAVAACALDREREPHISCILQRVGQRLGWGYALAELWDAIRVPLLGTPRQSSKLGPQQMRSAETLDKDPASLEMAGDSG